MDAQEIHSENDGEPDSDGPRSAEAHEQRSDGNEHEVDAEEPHELHREDSCRIARVGARERLRDNREHHRHRDEGQRGRSESREPREITACLA